MVIIIENAFRKALAELDEDETFYITVRDQRFTVTKDEFRSFQGAVDGLNLKAGDILKGYCHGFFGRDSYEDKIVIDFTNHYILAREDGSRGDGRVVTCHIDEHEIDTINEMISQWKEKDCLED